MLHRVRVDRCDACWGCPLVVDLVDVLVQPWMMQQPNHNGDMHVLDIELL